MPFFSINFNRLTRKKKNVELAKTKEREGKMSDDTKDEGISEDEAKRIEEAGSVMLMEGNVRYKYWEKYYFHRSIWSSLVYGVSMYNNYKLLFTQRITSYI